MIEKIEKRIFALYLLNTFSIFSPLSLSYEVKVEHEIKNIDKNMSLKLTLRALFYRKIINYLNEKKPIAKNVIYTI